MPMSCQRIVAAPSILGKFLLIRHASKVFRTLTSESKKAPTGAFLRKAPVGGLLTLTFPMLRGFGIFRLKLLAVVWGNQKATTVLTGIVGFKDLITSLT